MLLLLKSGAYITVIKVMILDRYSMYHNSNNDDDVDGFSIYHGGNYAELSNSDSNNVEGLRTSNLITIKVILMG